MKNNKNDIIKFFVWMRNGIAFCTTWLLIIWIAYCHISNQQQISVSMLTKLLLGIHISSLPILSKNLFTFCCSTPLVPLAFLLSKILKIDFQNKENPLSGLGLLISLNQMLYILIAMWVYAVMPEKMLMVYAIIFGAHLLPYGWLYQSKTYYVFSILIPIIVLLLGIYAPTFFVAVFMLITEIIFCSLLILENKKVKCYETN